METPPLTSNAVAHRMVRVYVLTLMGIPALAQNDSLIQAGIRLSSEGRYAESVSVLMSAGADTGSVVGRAQLGLAYTGLNDVEHARKYLSEAVDLDTNNVATLFLYARFLQQNLVLLEAATLLRRVAQLDSAHAAAAFQLAQIYRVTNEPDSIVRAQYRRSIRLNPTDYLAMYYLGSSLADSNATRHEGEYFLKQSLTINPYFLPSIERLGSYYSHLSQDSLAARYYAAGVALRPRNADLWFYLGESIRKLRATDSAVACFRRALELDSTKGSYAGQLGYAYFQAKQYEPAILAYRRAIELDSDNVQFYVNLALTYSRVDSIDLAARAYRAAIRILDPLNIAQMYENMGTLYFRAERHTEAAQAYLQALTYDPTNAEFHFLAAFSLEQGSQFDRALRLYRTYLNATLGDTTVTRRRSFAESRIEFIEAYMKKVAK